LQACRSSPVLAVLFYLVEFPISKKMTEFWDPRESGIFYGFAPFHFQAFWTGMQSELIFLAGRCEDLCVRIWMKKSIHFACQYGGLTSGSLKIW
jgi:hypothetical protein